jgi:hypothetical protein
MGWLENGDALRETWLDNAMKGIELRYGPIESWRPIPPSRTVCPDCGGQHGVWIAGPYKKGLSPEFIKALEASTKTDMSPLADYVSSDKPLSKEERKIIAGRLPRRKTGRPKNAQLRGAASMAWMFYQEWRSRNKSLGIPDHGHCDDMKDFSAQWMVEDYFHWGNNGEELTEDNVDDFIADARELMEKSKRRRDGADRCIVTVPGFGYLNTTKSRG